MSQREAAWQRIVDARDGAFPIQRAALRALSLLYGAGVAAYRAGFDSRLLRVTRLPCPVIGIGNLTLGGTGKSTAVSWVVRQLLELGCRPAILSRGYAARRRRPWTVVADRERILAPVEESGDEPQMLARAFPGVPVVVGRNRRRTGSLARTRLEADSLVLDDSFQYWRLKKDLELLIVNATRPLAGEPLFPRGRLREPLRGISRADAVIISHADRADPQRLVELRHQLLCSNPSLPIAETWHRPAGFTRLGISGAPLELPPGRWLAISSLGEPASFAATLSLLPIDSVPQPFPDHHDYTAAEIQSLVRRVREEGLAGILTTAKDAVKIQPAWLGDTPCGVLRVDLEFLNGRGAIEELLRACIGKSS